MADGVSVTILNRERLIKRLRALAPAAGPLIAQASMQGAEEMAAFAKRLVPVDTGRLRESIQTDAVPESLGARVVAGGTETEVREGSGVMWNYARAVEFGTKPHRNKGLFAGSWNPGMPAQPFFYPAFRLLRKRFKGRITRAVNKAAKQVSAG